MTTLTRLLAGLALGLAASAASALDIQPYSAQALAAAQKAGKPVALHFHADWCPTCRAQEKVFNRSSPTPASICPCWWWTTTRNAPSSKASRCAPSPRLIVYRGEKETARLAGDTDETSLRAALKSAL
jgi:thiol-disulfide isomerase/thioredoxin